MKPLGLDTGLRRQLEAMASRGYPHEVCGLLVGRAGEVLRVTEGRNLSTERLRDRYTLDPQHFVDAIEASQEALEASGHWGVPTFVFDGEPFFGQDRIDVLLWRLRQAGLRDR